MAENPDEILNGADDRDWHYAPEDPFAVPNMTSDEIDRAKAWVETGVRPPDRAI